MADADTAAAEPPKRKNADLPVRLVSAVVMIGLAVGAVMAGDPWFDWFVLAVVLATYVEFLLLVVKATPNVALRLASLLAGAVYIGLAGLMLSRFPLEIVVGVVGAVVFVDTFAYFFGRTLGGPKIAPAISPSKTWAGLLGGIVGATVWIAGWIQFVARQATGDMAEVFGGAGYVQILIMGAATAVAAQSGDFLESWLKRRAGVKDSSKLIPGHGGVFDRTDGIIPVVLLAGVVLGAAR